MLKKIYFTFIFSLSTFLVNSQVVINEYSASNFDSHLDNYGEYEDWDHAYESHWEMWESGDLILTECF